MAVTGRTLVDAIAEHVTWSLGVSQHKENKVTQPTIEPASTVISPKVTATAAAGAVVTAIALVANLFGADVNVDPAVVAAVLTIIVTVSGYLRNDPRRV